MGMAASQARLLSITSRLADNELRAQVINNSKMRLATESSRVSENYINALNSATMMFSNYDVDGNNLYQKLSFNSLSAYSSYNNQYGLIDANGNILVSESDAANFRAANGDLNTFLANYGLVYGSTFWNEETFGGTDITLGEGDSAKTFSLEQLEQMYLGNTITNADGKVQMVDDNGNPITNDYNNMHYGYDASLSSFEYSYFVELVENLNNAQNYLDNLVNGTKKNWALGSTAGYISYGKNGSLGKKTWAQIYEDFVTNYDDRSLNDISHLLHGLDNTMQILINDGYIQKGEPRISGGYYPANSNSAACEIYESLSSLGLYNDVYGASSDDRGRVFVQSKRTNAFTSDKYSEFTVPNADGTQRVVNIPKTINFGPSFTNEDGSVTYMFSATAIKGSGKQTVYQINLNSDYKSTLLNDDDTAASIYWLKGKDNGNCDRFDDSNGNASGNTGWPIEMTYEELCSNGLSVQVVYNDTDESGTKVRPDEYFCKIANELNPGIWTVEDVIRLNTINNDAAGNGNLEDSRLNEIQSIVKNLVLDWQVNIMDALDSELFIKAEQLDTKDGTIKQALEEYRLAKYDLLHFIYGNNAVFGTRGNHTDPSNVTYTQLSEFANSFSIDRYNEEGISYLIEYMNSVNNDPSFDPNWKKLSFNNSSNEGSVGADDNQHKGHGYGLGMTPILDIYYLDELFNKYGEPSYGWFDTNNSDENAEAKVQWYTNLFNRMAQGYKVLEDGLASSNEWIQFAFESGLVTMEQVDKSNNWQSTLYTNCSDITEVTDQNAVAVAEAEYNKAMNNIENKDKRFDMELKNIDTEHNSLQQEYDSIKSVIDKNIERSFKIYS